MLNERIDIPQQGWIELIDIMPHPNLGDTINPDLAVVNAARVSFLGESKGAMQDEKLLRYLMKHRHWTPFEMVEFKFRLRAPLLVFWQLVRHRTASLNLQSGRYTPFQEDDFYIPSIDSWRMQSKSNKQGSSKDRMSKDSQIEFVNALREGFPEITHWTYPEIDQWEMPTETANDTNVSDLLQLYADMGFRIYDMLLDEGVAKEQARLFLPGFSVKYTAVWKMDLRNLLNFISLRTADDAQEEIRLYANEIYKVVKHYCPWTIQAYEDFSPK